MKKGLQGRVKEEQEPMPEQKLSKEEMLDVEIGVGLVGKFLKEPQAQQIIDEAMNGQGEPGAKLGVFFAQMIDKLQTKMQDTPTPLSPKIWLAQGGVIDQVCQRIGVPEEIVVATKDEIMNILKLQSQSMNNQGPPPPEEMPMEAGAPPMGAPPMQPPMMEGM